MANVITNQNMNGYEKTGLNCLENRFFLKQYMPYNNIIIYFIIYPIIMHQTFNSFEFSSLSFLI